jgi:hypothetical protein
MATKGQIEQCHHSNCGYQNRLEYCDIDAADRDGIAVEVTGMVDAMLCEPKSMSGSRLKVRVDTDSHIISRQFHSLHSDTASDATLETMTYLEYGQTNHLHRERYTVGIQWLTALTHNKYLSTAAGYSIDLYPAGPVQGLVCESDGSTRRITNYDFKFLFKHVAELAEIYIP